MVCLFFKHFTFIDDSLMNSFKTSLDICMNMQVSLLVKFTSNLYSVFSLISSKHFQVYYIFFNNIEICTSLLMVIILKNGMILFPQLLFLLR